MNDILIGVINVNTLNHNAVCDAWCNSINMELVVKVKERINSLCKELQHKNNYSELKYFLEEEIKLLDMLEDEYEHDYNNQNSTFLIGDWNYNKGTGKFEPDKEKEYAAIMDDDVVMVVWSQYREFCKKCSPCYPNGGNLEEISEEYGFATYNLPEYFYVERDYYV